jgi:hypothetical protein
MWIKVLSFIGSIMTGVAISSIRLIAESAGARALGRR